MSISDLAAAILADRIRFSDDEPATVLQEGAPTKCFACAASFTYRKDPVDGRNGRFCSQRCQAAYDIGVVHKPMSNRLMRARGAGFALDCAFCKHEFSSKGLRCCSPECETKLRDRQRSEAELASLGLTADQSDFKTRRRPCLVCGSLIPLFRKGRAVSKSAKFCSPRCTRRGARNL